MRKVNLRKIEAKRRHILDAAVGCFARNGFHSTSTAEICTAAGMSPGNLFHYFHSKSAIIEAIALEGQQEVIEIFAKLSVGEDAVAAIENIAIAMMELNCDPISARISIEVAAEATRNPEIGALFVSSEADMRAGLEALLKRGIVAGQIDPVLDIALAAIWLLALAEGAIGRVVMDSNFKARAHKPMLRKIVRGLLRPH